MCIRVVVGKIPFFFFMLLTGMIMSIPAQAEPLSLSDEALEGIAAQGIATGGDFSSTCTTSSSSICVGSYEWNDNHQFDASSDKGAIVMDGYVQQNVTANSVVNATQSATATGVNIIGDIQLSGSTIDMANSNNSTSFIGGF